MWPSNRFIDLIGIELPIIQAPMAGFATVELAASVSEAGGLGSLGLSAASPETMRSEVARFRLLTEKPINMNFFCHEDIPFDEHRHRAWHDKLAPYRRETGINSDVMPPAVNRPPFGEAACAAVEEIRPDVVSFHFGMPDRTLVTRVKAAGCKVLCSATTVAEARLLEALGADAIIAQGSEAGGHRGMFLSDEVASQPGTMALVPQVVDAVGVPVIAAGAIADARGIVAAFALGACGVQMGTAFLLCPESGVPPLHRAALRSAEADETALTNVFTGRPARVLVNRFVREMGPIAEDAPQFPGAAPHYNPLRDLAESKGNTDFTALWAGQTAKLGREIPAKELTPKLALEAQELMKYMGKA
jgi:nitronate monooxygenase